MKRLVIDVEKEKVPFIMELIENLDFVSLVGDISDDDKGMYDSIVSLQKGVGIPVDEE